MIHELQKVIPVTDVGPTVSYLVVLGNGLQTVSDLSQEEAELGDEKRVADKSELGWTDVISTGRTSPRKSFRPHQALLDEAFA